ncbi:glycoside hydrolase family 25 protein [Butyrivibrio sp. JL13D10]|uniref:glycoside hydrolase family 25 protein n=1 Tax=Butyrivibrio sp. JL13D10 TaxID=3236815 RepID=UPI0038B48D9D
MKNTDVQKNYSKMVKNTKVLISVIFLSLVSILSLSTCIGLLLSNAATKRQADAAQSELDALEKEGYYTTAQAQQLMDQAVSVTAKQAGDEIREAFKTELSEGNKLGAIRSLFPDEIVTEFAGQYSFTPIDKNLKRNPFLAEDLKIDEDGFLYYAGANENISVSQGIDISRSQGDIDFNKVSEAGIDFVMIRAGLRGSAEGQLLEDDYFKTNLKKAVSAGLDVGVYFYSQAINTAEAAEEADFVIGLLQGAEIDYPIAIDLEQVSSSDARTAKLSKTLYSDIAKTFCEKISEAGYVPMIQGSIRTFGELIDTETIQSYPTWIIYHDYPQYYPYEYYMWQYSKNSDIAGIEGEVNMNICVDIK